jgi:hypothetical protein
LELDSSTRFARSLGFYEEGRWSLDTPSRSMVLDKEDTVDLDALERTVKAKRFSIEESDGNFSYLADDFDFDDGQDEVKPPQPPADDD